MRDREWRLTYPGTEFSFGPADDPVFFTSAPDVADPPIRTDDADRPREDGRAFGVDFRGGRTITFECGVLGADEAAVRATLATMAGAWRADTLREEPGAVAELRTRNAGRERVALGRPRRFVTVEDDIDNGAAVVLADFATVSDLWYGDEESVTLSITPPSGGGLVAPLASPLTTTASSDRSGGITVAGEVGAWPVVTIDGPITNPTVEVVGRWSLTLETSLAFDQSVTVDTRPWARSVLRADGGSLAGSLTRTSVRLSRAALPPGSYEVVLRGTDATGTSGMRFAWRPSYTTL